MAEQDGIDEGGRFERGGRLPEAGRVAVLRQFTDDGRLPRGGRLGGAGTILSIPFPVLADAASNGAPLAVGGVDVDVRDGLWAGYAIAAETTSTVTLTVRQTGQTLGTASATVALDGTVTVADVSAAAGAFADAEVLLSGLLVDVELTGGGGEKTARINGVAIPGRLTLAADLYGDGIPEIVGENEATSAWLPNEVNVGIAEIDGKTQITSANSVGGGARVSLNLLAGVTYRVRYNVTLGTATAIDISVTVNSNGTGGSITGGYFYTATGGAKEAFITPSVSGCAFVVAPRGIDNTVLIDSVEIVSYSTSGTIAQGAEVILDAGVLGTVANTVEVDDNVITRGLGATDEWRWQFPAAAGQIVRVTSDYPPSTPMITAGFGPGPSQAYATVAGVGAFTMSTAGIEDAGVVAAGVQRSADGSTIAMVLRDHTGATASIVESAWELGSDVIGTPVLSGYADDGGGSYSVTSSSGASTIVGENDLTDGTQYWAAFTVEGDAVDFQSTSYAAGSHQVLFTASGTTPPTWTAADTETSTVSAITVQPVTSTADRVTGGRPRGIYYLRGIRGEPVDTWPSTIGMGIYTAVDVDATTGAAGIIGDDASGAEKPAIRVVKSDDAPAGSAIVAHMEAIFDQLAPARAGE